MEGLARELLRTEDGAEPVAIVHIVVVHVGTGVVAGYLRIVVVEGLGEPFVLLLLFLLSDL